MDSASRRVRRLMLYPVELRGREFRLWSESQHRTELRHGPAFAVLKIWGGKRESNPQPSEPQSGALPVELFPPLRLIIATAQARCQKPTWPRDLAQTSDLRHVRWVLVSDLRSALPTFSTDKILIV
jgi:hypothetical protein